MNAPSLEALSKSAPTPFALGYRIPAEWEPHEATWLAWPHNEETWPGKLREVEKIYLQMIEALSGGEKVRLLVQDEATRGRVAQQIRARGILEKNIIFYLIPTADAWIRDYGPCFLLKESGAEKELALVRWRFNAWGGKYESLAQDDLVLERLAPLLGLPVFHPGLVLEGGAIDTNGQGTGLVTEQCLLNPNRNPHLDRKGVEEALKDFLGLSHLIWLKEGIVGDDTDGHVDELARFVNPTTVVAGVEPNPLDPNEAPLRENLKRLREARVEDGKSLTVVTLPMPDPVEGLTGRLPASYLNFYIANGVVLVPIFGQKKDKDALQILKELFPKRKVLGIRSEILVEGLGAIHCVTHEEPRPL